MRLRRSVLPMVMVAMASPAHACMSDPLPSAMLFDKPPEHVPNNTITIYVRPSALVQGSYTVRATVLEDASYLLANQRVEIAPEWPTSCLAVGRMDKAAYVVVAKPEHIAGEQVLIAKSYKRSWWDTFWSFFGWESFTPAGEPLGNPFPNAGIPA